MKKFIFGLAVGIGTTYLVQRISEKNHEQLMELLQNLPRPTKIGVDTAEMFGALRKPQRATLEDAELN